MLLLPDVPVQAMRAFLYGPSAIRSLDDLNATKSRPRAYTLNVQYTTISAISFFTMVVRDCSPQLLQADTS